MCHAFIELNCALKMHCNSVTVIPLPLITPLIKNKIENFLHHFISLEDH